jgi:hypothetical protein
MVKKIILDKNQNVMKNSIIILIIFCFSVLRTAAQGLNEKENSLLDNFIKSKIAVEKEKIVSDTLQKVFSGAVYKVKAGYSDESGISYCTEDYFVIKDNILIPFTTSDLFVAVRSDFFIKNEADAKIFETALDKIKPISWDSKELKEHLKKENRWYFVRGKFFDSKSAFIVTVGQDGKISAIGYDMEAIKK